MRCDRKEGREGKRGEEGADEARVSRAGAKLDLNLITDQGFDPFFVLISKVAIAVMGAGFEDEIEGGKSYPKTAEGSRR